MFYTYVYRDPSRLNTKGFPEEIYVGKGRDKRAYSHLKRKDTHPLTSRIKHMRNLGVEPTIEIIPALDEDHAYFMEKCLMDIIGSRIDNTGPLLNIQTSSEFNPDRAKSISNARKGQRYSEEGLAKIRAAAKARTGKTKLVRSPEAEARRLAALKSPEAKEKMRQAQLARFANPEEKQKLIDRTIASWKKRK